MENLFSSFLNIGNFSKENPRSKQNKKNLKLNSEFNFNFFDLIKSLKRLIKLGVSLHQKWRSTLRHLCLLVLLASQFPFLLDFFPLCSASRLFLRRKCQTRSHHFQCWNRNFEKLAGKKNFRSISQPQQEKRKCFSFFVLKIEIYIYIMWVELKIAVT